MKLYYAPGACSLAPHIVAREADLPVELIRVDLRNRTTETGQSFEDINPKGYVPALAAEDGEVLTEASAIIQYLASKAPQADLAPRSQGFEHFRFLEWLGFISTELHKGFGPLWRPNFPEEVKQATRDRLFQRFAFVDEHLGDNPYVMGANFTVADAYLFAVLNWAHVHKLDMSAYPNIIAFMARVAARPKVREALAAEGLLQNAA